MQIKGNRMRKQIDALAWNEEIFTNHGCKKPSVCSSEPGPWWLDQGETRSKQGSPETNEINEDL
jgi:hypothetical protein